MSLSAETCLRGVLFTLQDRVIPVISDPFAMEAARLAALVLTLTANSVDGAVAIRVAENDRMRKLFLEAAQIVTSRDLAERLKIAASSVDPGLRVSELDRENDKLRLLLIDLHAHAETLADDRAVAFCKKIWRTISDFEMARAPQL